MKVSFTYSPSDEVKKDPYHLWRPFSLTLGGYTLRDVGIVRVYRKDRKPLRGDENLQGNEVEFFISHEEEEALSQELMMTSPSFTSQEGDKLSYSEMEFILSGSESPRDEELGKRLISGERYEEIWEIEDDGKMRKVENTL